MKSTLELPCHIVETPGDNRAICGTKDPVPVVARRWASAHTYPHARCVECYTSAGLIEMLDGITS